MRFIFILTLVILSMIVNASDNERVELSNYLRELNKIDRLISRAKYSTNKNEETVFNYILLEKDLNNLKQGIQEYLNSPNRNPRVITEHIEPISGAYLQ